MTSALTHPKSAISNPQDWITIDEAATLTGRSIRRWQQRAEVAFHRGLARKGPPATGKGKAVWWVHRSLDRRLAIGPDRPSRQQRDRKPMRQAQRTAARRTRTAAQRINAYVREQQSDLLATGTDDAAPNLVPVRTGFEGLSIPDRLEPLGRDACGPDGSDITDLVADETQDAVEASEDSGLEDLFEDLQETDTGGEGEDAESDLDDLL